MTSTIRDEDTAHLGAASRAPHVGHFYFDVARGKLHCLNEAARELRGAGLPLMAGDAVNDQLRTTDGAVVAPDALPPAVAQREGRRVEAEYLLCRPGQPERPAHYSASPFKDADGRVGAVMASVVVLPPAPDWAVPAGLAHDLRTPLQTVTVSLQILEFRTLADAERETAVQRLAAAAGRAQQIAQELLEWCRGRGARGPQARRAWFPVEPLLQEVAAEQQPAATQKGLMLNVAASPVRGWQVFSDRGRLARVLANLLVNAVRYTPAGGRINVDAAWEDVGGARTLVLDVRDTGAGIPAHEQESIFHPFERGQSGRDSDAGGSGIGLSVVDRLTQDLGLRCEVHSESGRGSRFRVLVPQTLLRMAPGPAPG